MAVIGLIAEWNPFHNGHAYLIQQIKAKFPESLIIVCLSGDYVQRGEPAVLSKWDRAKCGLKAGVDLIFELPVWYATQAADLFAEGAVHLLNALGCEVLAFGTEVENFSDVEMMATWMAEHPEEVAQAEITLSTKNLNYANRQNALIQELQSKYEELAPLHVDFTHHGNTLLAFSYAKSNAGLDQPMTLFPVKRKTEGEEFQTATTIRQFLLTSSSSREEKEEKLRHVVPSYALSPLLERDQFPSWSSFYPYVRFQLISQDLDQINSIYQIFEGYGKVLQSTALEASDFDQFIEGARSKYWSTYRVQRALLMEAFQFTDHEMKTYLDGDQPLFLLAATKKGRTYLQQLKKAPLTGYHGVSRVNQAVAEQWPKWFVADRLYQHFLLHSSRDEDFGRPPLLADGGDEV